MCLDMENFFCSGSGWSTHEEEEEDAGLAQFCQTGLNSSTSDNSFLVPNWIKNPAAPLASEYYCSSSSFHENDCHDYATGGSSFHENECHGYATGGFPFWSEVENFEGVEEGDKAATASKNHSQAEKRRRDRINAHLATLRKLISKSDNHKMEKAALLGRVVEQVKDLKRKVTELSKVFTVPTDIDEVIIDSHSDSDSCPGHHESSKTTISTGKSKEGVFIKATVCCDDRPELFSELKHALKGLSLTTVRADMTSLGGRIKGSFILCREGSTNELDGIGMNTLKQSLRVVLSRIASSSTASNYRIKSKRQRFFFPSHQSQ